MSPWKQNLAIKNSLLLLIGDNTTSWLCVEALHVYRRLFNVQDTCEFNTNPCVMF